jgi:hypothetical protein
MTIVVGLNGLHYPGKKVLHMKKLLVIILSLVGVVKKDSDYYYHNSTGMIVYDMNHKEYNKKMLLRDIVRGYYY